MKKTFYATLLLMCLFDRCNKEVYYYFYCHRLTIDKNNYNSKPCHCVLKR